MRHVSARKYPLFAFCTLGLLSACDGAAPRGPGTITVTSSVQVLEPTIFQYGVSIDSGTPRTVAVGELLSFTQRGLAHGAHFVTTTGVPTRCTGGERRDVEVRGDDTVLVPVNVQCARITGDIVAAATTTGTNIDPDGYFLFVDQFLATSLPSNGSVIVNFVAVGTHSVAISNVASNCTAPPAQTVSVSAGARTNVAFAVTCVPTATLRFVSSASGSDRDPDGLTVRVDNGAETRNPLTGTRDVSVNAGTHTYALSDVAPNCTLGGPATGTVTLAQGETATIPTSLTCTAAPIGTVGVAVTDATGDTLANGARNPAVAHDIRSVSARYDAGWLILVLGFGRPPGSSGVSTSGLHGVMDLDTDERTNTGAPPFINSFGGSASQGSDYSIDLFDTDSVSSAIYSNLIDTDLGRVRTTFAGDSVVIHIPLAKLGNDDGNMTVTMVVGTSDRPTDIAPNSAVITARVPTGPIIVSTGAVRASPPASTPSERARPRRSIGKWKVTR